MWNPTSRISWLLARTGHARATISPAYPRPCSWMARRFGPRVPPEQPSTKAQANAQDVGPCPEFLAEG
jgi:hypothetical protein